MNKKTILILIIAIIIIGLTIYINFTSNSFKTLEQTFVVTAVYYENDGYAEISFHDKSNKTKHVTLEILGMSESFHKEFDTTIFVEKIQFASTPKYGWQSMPIILLVEHEKFENVGIKTEIRPFGAVPAKIIFSND